MMKMSVKVTMLFKLQHMIIACAHIIQKLQILKIDTILFRLETIYK